MVAQGIAAGQKLLHLPLLRLVSARACIRHLRVSPSPDFVQADTRIVCHRLVSVEIETEKYWRRTSMSGGNVQQQVRLAGQIGLPGSPPEKCMTNLLPRRQAVQRTRFAQEITSIRTEYGPAGVRPNWYVSKRLQNLRPACHSVHAAASREPVWPLRSVSRSGKGIGQHLRFVKIVVGLRRNRSSQARTTETIRRAVIAFTVYPCSRRSARKAEPPAPHPPPGGRN